MTRMRENRIVHVSLTATAVFCSIMFLCAFLALESGVGRAAEHPVDTGLSSDVYWHRLTPQLSDKIGVMSCVGNGGIVAGIPSDGLIVREDNGEWLATSPEYWPGVWFGHIAALDPLSGVVLASVIIGNEEHGGCIFRSTDYGESWVMIDPDPSSTEDAYYRFGWSAADPSRVYLGAFGGLWASDDSGQSWYSISHGHDEIITTDIAVHPEDADILLTGSRGDVKGIFRSSDGGESWTRVSSELHITIIEWDPLDPDLVLAVGITDALKYRFTRSTDGGLTWTVQNIGEIRGSIEFAGLPGVAVASGKNSEEVSTLYYTTNGGLTWQVLTELGDLGILTDWDLTFVDGKPILVAAIDRNGIFVSPDFGINWYPAGPSRGRVKKVVVDSDRPGRGIAGTDDYLFASLAGPGHCFLTEDIGRTWRDVQEFGWPCWGQVSCALFSPADPQEIYVGSDYLAGTLACSLDNGNTWNQCVAGLPRPRCIIRSPHDQEIIYVGHDRSLSVPTTPPGVWRRDQEWNWENIWESPHPVQDIWASPLEPGVLLAALGETSVVAEPAPGGGLYRSNDGGYSWSEDPFFTNLHVSWIRQEPGEPDHIWVGTLFDTYGGGVYLTVNGGADWSDVSSSFFYYTVRDLLFLEEIPGRCFAATDRGVLESPDGGDTWHESNDGLLVSGTGNDLLSLDTYSIDADELTGRIAVGTRTGIFGSAY